MKYLELKPLDEIVYTIIRKSYEHIYYLNEQGVIEKFSIRQATSEDIQKFEDRQPHGNANAKAIFEFHYIFNIYDLMEKIIIPSDYNIEYQKWVLRNVKHERVLATVENHSRYGGFKFMIGQIKEGMTYDEMQELLKWTEDFYIEHNSYNNIAYSNLKGIDKYITKICRPIIIREPENLNKHSFDIIKIDVNLTSDSDRYRYIKSHKQELIQKVLENLKKYSAFRRYGVPVNVLRCTRIHTVGANTIEIIFELKQLQK